MQFLANTRMDDDIPKTELPSDETNSEDHESSEGLLNPVGTESPDVGTSMVDATELEQTFEESGRKYRETLERLLKDVKKGTIDVDSTKVNTGEPEPNYVSASETQLTENADKGAEDEQNQAADPHSAIDQSKVTELPDPDAGAAKVDSAIPESGGVSTSDIQTVEPGGTDGEIKDSEAAGTQPDTRAFIPMPIHNDDPTDDPKEVLHQMTQQLWKQAIWDVKATLSEDYEVYKEWKPVKPFSEMLVEALDRDTEWRRNGDYAEKDMYSLIRDAISITVTSKRGKRNGGIGFYEWK